MVELRSGSVSITLEQEQIAECDIYLLTKHWHDVNQKETIALNEEQAGWLYAALKQCFDGYCE